MQCSKTWRPIDGVSCVYIPDANVRWNDVLLTIANKHSIITTVQDYAL